MPMRRRFTSTPPICSRSSARPVSFSMIDRRQRLGEKVVARLDVAAAAECARQRLEMVRAHLNARALKLAYRRAQAGALRDLDFGGHARHRQRRADVPGGVTTGGEHDE